MIEKEFEQSTLILSPLSKQQKYVLMEDYYVHVHLRGLQRTVKIEKEFTTDGGSLPRIFWTTTITPFDPKGIEAFIVHDAAYQQGGLYIMEFSSTKPITRIKKFLPLTRAQADELLRRMMKADGVNMYIRNKVYYGLKVGGWRAWNKYRKES